MSQNMPVLVLNNTGILPALSDSLTQKLQANFDASFEGFGESNFRRIKVRKTDFLLMEGGNQSIIGPQELIGVFVAAAPRNHCVWYEQEYAQGQEPTIPDLMWVQSEDGMYPDALPPQFRRKVLKNGKERWDFQILRRIAFALVKTDPSTQQQYLDLDNPVIIDLSSMSMYGDSFSEQNMFKWSGIKKLCMQYSKSYPVTPNMFLTQIIIDPNTSNSGVVMFRPSRDPKTGVFQYLDPALIEQVVDCGTSAAVQDMLKIREKLTWKNANPANPVGAGSIPTPPPGQVMDAAFLGTVIPSTNSTPINVPMPEPTPITPPVQDTGFPDMNSLLAQADAVLNTAPVDNAASNPAIPDNPFSAPASGPVFAEDPTGTTNTIQDLLSQLEG